MGNERHRGKSDRMSVISFAVPQRIEDLDVKVVAKMVGEAGGVAG
jgi:hypothetical protein